MKYTREDFAEAINVGPLCKLIDRVVDAANMKLEEIKSTKEEIPRDIVVDEKLIRRTFERGLKVVK